MLPILQVIQREKLMTKQQIDWNVLAIVHLTNAFDMFELKMHVFFFHVLEAFTWSNFSYSEPSSLEYKGHINESSAACVIFNRQTLMPLVVRIGAALNNESYTEVNLPRRLVLVRHWQKNTHWPKPKSPWSLTNKKTKWLNDGFHINLGKGVSIWPNFIKNSLLHLRWQVFAEVYTPLSRIGEVEKQRQHVKAKQLNY